MAVVPAERAVRTVDHPEPPPPEAGEVLVRTLEVGICGTDAELCAFHFGHPPSDEPYLVLGHEALGVVEAVGSGVTGVAPGELVVPSVRRPCSVEGCVACRAGYADHCTSGEYTERGIFGAHGFLTQRFVEHSDFLHRVPQSLRHVGVLTEPLTIAEKGVRQFLAARRRLPWLTDADDQAVMRGVRALVLGAGPVGLLAAMLLRSRGCTVAVYSREPAGSERASIVEAIGGRYVAGGEVPLEGVGEVVGGIDLVYEAAGSATLSLAMVREMGPNGVFVLTGATGGAGRTDLAADAFLNRMVVRNLVLAGTVNAAPQDFATAIADLERFERLWPGVARRLITHRHSLERFPERVSARTGIKEVVVMGLEG